VNDRSQQRVYQSIGNPASYYSLLELHPSASPVEIRRSYRELSKRYHPDTTTLPQEVATAKFLKLNEAYAALSNPERRSLYDQSLNYSKYHVIQPPTDLNIPVNQAKPFRSSAYLDPSDRPLSSGEISALLFLGLALAGCLILAIGLGLTRGHTTMSKVEIIDTSKPLQSGVLPYNQVRLNSVQSNPSQSNPSQSNQGNYLSSYMPDFLVLSAPEIK